MGNRPFVRITRRPDTADVGFPTNASDCTMGGGRSYPELFYSGILTAQQVIAQAHPGRLRRACRDARRGALLVVAIRLVARLCLRPQVDDIYRTQTTSNNSGYGTRPMTLGCAGYNSKQVIVPLHLLVLLSPTL